MRVFKLFLVGLMCMPVFCQAVFPDVPKTHRHCTAIEYLQSQNIIGGYDNGNFGPDDPITRAQALKIILLGGGHVTNQNQRCHFSDVVNDHFGHQYIAYAYANGIVKGNDDGSFDPDRQLNQAEALKMVLETNQVQLDHHAVGEWYVPYISYAMKNGLIDRETPGENMTRGDLAQVMYRLLNIPVAQATGGGETVRVQADDVQAIETVLPETDEQTGYGFRSNNEKMPTRSYACSPTKTCGEIASCDEAYYRLETCRHTKLDRDKDGIPCETLCGN